MAVVGWVVVWRGVQIIVSCLAGLSCVVVESDPTVVVAFVVIVCSPAQYGGRAAGCNCCTLMLLELWRRDLCVIIA